MFIARWQFTARFGKLEDCVSILRRWEMDVGARVGWKMDSVRILAGFIGASDSDVEFETRVENLTDFEAAWGDLERNPHHREYLKQLDNLIVSGTSRWLVFKDIKLITEA